jgi:aminocarboxymuconate-semialdehyde decarboxylase
LTVVPLLSKGPLAGRGIFPAPDGFKEKGLPRVCNSQFLRHESRLLAMPIVDIHTHIYPPAFVSLLKSRKEVPYIRTFPDAPNNERLIILPGEDDPSMPSTARGRPFTADYSDIFKKIEFMNKHDIDVSVISLANPWLDFLAPEEAPEMAKKVNNNMNDICGWVPGRLYAFGTLPLTASAGAVVDEITRLAHMPNIKGVIMGTSGLGKGLDDPELEPIYSALEATGTLIFLHPHYGLPAQVYGPAAANYGHILPLALGFPLETTIAVSRMILSGVFDRYPELNVLLAHSGGTLPFLAGRLESCIKHDAHFKKAGLLENRRDIWTILKTNIYLDAVIYSEVGLTSAVLASGHDRMMFGRSKKRATAFDRLILTNLQARIIHSSHHWRKTAVPGVVSRKTTLPFWTLLSAMTKRQMVCLA